MKNLSPMIHRLALLFVGAAIFVTGCDSPGPAEKAGKAVDESVEKAKDAINPPGPAEKAGRELDKGLNK